MQLPFGKRVMLGGFYVYKHVKALSKKDLKALRAAQGIPAEVQKHLTRGVLPYITIGTVSDSWSIEFVMGMNMYQAIDEIPVAVDENGVPTYYGTGYQNLGNIINGWFAYTSTVGDAQYQAEVIKAMQDYLKRMSEAEKEPLSEEDNAKVLQEAEDTERRKATLLAMSGEILESEKEQEDNEQTETKDDSDGKEE